MGKSGQIASDDARGVGGGERTRVKLAPLLLKSKYFIEDLSDEIFYYSYGELLIAMVELNFRVLKEF